MSKPSFGFADVFREYLRRARGTGRQIEFARRSGMSQSMISYLERGERSVRAEHIDQLITGLDLDIVDFLTGLSAIAAEMKASSAEDSPQGIAAFLEDVGVSVQLRIKAVEEELEQTHSLMTVEPLTKEGLRALQSKAQAIQMNLSFLQGEYRMIRERLDNRRKGLDSLRRIVSPPKPTK